MELTDFNRINKAVDIELLKNIHVICLGTGGSFSLLEALTRTGVGKLTCLDIDCVEAVNITRQGFQCDQIGMLKVAAVGEHLATINSGLTYKGIADNFLFWEQAQLDEVFGSADIIISATDSFNAQARCNELAIKYQKPTIWPGFYPLSQCFEIVFFIPNQTGCYRCACGSRYAAQENTLQDVTHGNGYNTFFHSALLDSITGMILMAIIHRNTVGYQFSGWFTAGWDRTLLQFRTHPSYSNNPGNIFQRTFEPLEGLSFCYDSIWRKVSRKPDCPDCGKPITTDSI